MQALRHLQRKTHRVALIGLGLASLGLLSTSAVAINLSNPTVGGAADIGIYTSDGTTVSFSSSDASDTAAILAALAGSAAAPGGNVELSYNGGSPLGDISQATTLTGDLTASSITLSSLTAADWSASVGGTTFGRFWFDYILTQNGVVGVPPATFDNLYGLFLANDGRETFSDPNIAYVNDNGGIVSVGLAGFLDAADLINPLLTSENLPNIPNIVISEIVKVSFGGQNGYLFAAGADSVTDSGQLGSDGVSFSGNFNLELTPLAQGGNFLPAPQIPVTGTLLLMLSGLGLIWSRRRY